VARHRLLGWGFVGWALAACAPAYAGLISGTVRAGDARVEGAEVNALHINTRRKVVAKTQANGAFFLRGVPEGACDIYVLAPGMEVASSAAVVREGHVLRLDFSLRPAEPTVPVADRSGPKRTRMGGSVQPARLLVRVVPEYPEPARAAGFHGAVAVRAVVRTDGALGGISVLDSPDPSLSDAAMRALAGWRYEPTRLNGQPVETVTTINFEFQLSSN
jgi:TonB family protein